MAPFLPPRPSDGLNEIMKAKCLHPPELLKGVPPFHWGGRTLAGPRLSLGLSFPINKQRMRQGSQSRLNTRSSWELYKC